MRNQLIEKPVEEKKEPNQNGQRKKETSVGRAFFSVLDGSILTHVSVLEFLPFLFYVTFLALFYIGNTYYAERKMLRINKTTKELKELRYEYITATSELMHLTKQSEIANRNELKILGVKESMVPPFKIYKNKN